MKTIKQLSIFLVFITLSTSLFSQYQLGEKTIVYQDPDRDNRNIETVIFYPATSAGVDAPIASGQFPVITFGHGFIMADPDLYQYLWDHLAPMGYICLFPTTEGGSPPFSTPDHETFGLDLKFLNTKIKSEGNNSSSFFYNKIASETAIMGHSMGGKATYIASANNTDITTVISLGAALGNPPIGNSYDAMETAVPFVVVPTLVVNAEFDCVVEEEDGHKNIFYNLTTDCKTYVEILGGGHCYFASSDASNCETGEGWMGGNCAGDFYISREEQNQTVLNTITPYLDFYLNGNAQAENDFLNYIQNSPDVLWDRECETVEPNPVITDVDINNNVQNISVAYGTSENDAIAQLANQITIKDSDNQTHLVNLSWTVNSYNGTNPAVYNATGNFSLPNGVDQSNPPTNLYVTATITVLDEQVENPHITEIDVNDEVNNITVPFGTSENDAKSQLAQSILIKDSNNQTHIVDLSWAVAGYNSQLAGNYPATGSFSLPNGVDQANPPINLFVTAIITVDQASSINFSFEDSKLSVYPNPAKDILIIEYIIFEDAEIILTDNKGSIVNKIQLSKGKSNTKVNIEDLPAGYYNISCDKYSFSTKIIKTK